jgi:translation initiation factor 1
MAHSDRQKIDTSRSSVPLNSGAFGALDALQGQLPAAAEAPPSPPAKSAVEKPKRGRLILRREKKDRGGKTVVVVSGFAEIPGMHAAAIGDLARQLRQKLGCGGSFDRQQIVLQGDQPAKVCALLEEIGYRVDGVRC